MKDKKRTQPRSTLEDRFEFSEDAVAPGDRAALRPSLFEVRDRSTGIERTLNLGARQAALSTAT
jgi:hypothetical protein